MSTTEDLRRSLEAALGAAVEGLERLSGGASRETWRFVAREADGGERALILRRDPPGRPSQAGGMGLEARAIGAAHKAGLAVPEVLLADDEPGSFGSAGLVMELVEGETIARRILRDAAYRDAREQRLAAQCGEFLAGLHAIPPESVPGVSGPSEADQLDGLHSWYLQLGQPVATFEYAFRWLDENRPTGSTGTAIVHGDFRLGNLIVGEDGLRAVLDWELLHLGDPLEDLGWLCTKAWRFGAPLPVGGFGTYDQLIEAYESAGGAAVDRDALRWWEIYGSLRWGVICVGQALAHLSGAVRSVELAAIGRRVCEQEWDLLALVASDAVATLEDTEAPPPPADAGAGLHGRPTAVELLDAVREFLEGDVMQAGGRLGFHGRVAARVVATVAREIAAGSEPNLRYQEALADLGAADEADLAAQVSAGAFAGRHEELTAFLARAVRDRLAVANPTYLTRN